MHWHPIDSTHTIADNEITFEQMQQEHTRKEKIKNNQPDMLLTEHFSSPLDSSI